MYPLSLKKRLREFQNGVASTSYCAASAERFRAEVEKAGVSFDDAEVWYYPNGTEHFPKIYILDEKTGFVYIYF